MTPDAAGEFSRVAISHEWLTIPGGSEKVVLAMLDLFPDADIFTSVYDPEPWPAAIREAKVTPSFLNRIPNAKRIYPRLLPLMNAAFESFDLSDYDLVLSSNHACAKNVITGPDTLHVCYCHTPMRYAWEPSFLAGEEMGPVARLALPPLLSRLRRQDFVGAMRPDVFAANSNHVAKRIEKYYRRDAEVIHPPVDVDRFLALDRRREDDYYLFLGRLVPYKRADLAVAACTRLGRRLKVIGGGRAAEELRQQAGPGVELLGETSDAELDEALAGARALLFPGEEDFGIVPVEAQAAGVPVIAYGTGGARDTVIDRRSGLLFDDQTADGLADAILKFEQIESEIEESAVRDSARRFGHERFARELSDLLTARSASMADPYSQKS